jgi:RNA polymerase sigma factor (sigma-70 family)
MADRQSDTKQELLSILLDRQAGLLRNARRVLKDEMEAEDIVQGVFETVIATPNILDDVQNVAAWLATLVYRRSIDLLRKFSRRRLLDEGVMDHMPDSNPSPAEIMEKKDIYDAVASAVESLPAELLYVFEGNVLDGKTFRQLSEESGIPMGTLMARKQRAVKQVKDALAQKEILPKAT